ncbi:MAG TPA: hypothetical protein VFI96_04680, partial [Longimicrobiaceae bacterium]|nr:hypothetical protein [Longimicrobiaceae bacterium]
TLPQGLMRNLDVGTARVYVSGTNLFTVTDYSGYTPQLTAADVIRSGIDLGVYPVMRTITAGVNLTF